MSEWGEEYISLFDKLHGLFQQFDSISQFFYKADYWPSSSSLRRALAVAGLTFLTTVTCRINDVNAPTGYGSEYVFSSHYSSSFVNVFKKRLVQVWAKVFPSPHIAP